MDYYFTTSHPPKILFTLRLTITREFIFNESSFIWGILGMLNEINKNTISLLLEYGLYHFEHAKSVEVCKSRSNEYFIMQKYLEFLT